MLSLQLETLGLPKQADILEVTVEGDMQRSLDRFCSQIEDQEKRDHGQVDERTAVERLHERYPHSPVSAVDLLAKMLSWAPSDRPCAAHITCADGQHSFADMSAASRRRGRESHMPTRRETWSTSSGGGGHTRLTPSSLGKPTAKTHRMDFPFEDQKQDRASLRGNYTSNPNHNSI